MLLVFILILLAIFILKSYQETYSDKKLKTIVEKLYTVFPELYGLNIYPSYKSSISRRNVGICMDGASENTIIYVILHELAHDISNEKRHSPLFWATFKKLIQRAFDYKLIVAEFVENYCNMDPFTISL